MATTRRNHCYVDFTQENFAPAFAKDTGAVPTAAGAQEAVFRVGGT